MLDTNRREGEILEKKQKFKGCSLKSTSNHPLWVTMNLITTLIKLLSIRILSLKNAGLIHKSKSSLLHTAYINLYQRLQFKIIDYAPSCDMLPYDDVNIKTGRRSTKKLSVNNESLSLAVRVPPKNDISFVIVTVLGLH